MMAVHCGADAARRALGALGGLGFALCVLTTGAAAQPTDGPVSRPDLKVGDTWVYDWTEQKGQNGFGERRMLVTLDRIDDDDMQVGLKQEGSPGGAQEQLYGRDWSILKNIDGREVSTGRPIVFPVNVGQRWSSDFTESGKGRVRSVHWHLDYHATGWVDDDTPVGKLHALRVEAKGVWKAELGPSSSALGGVVSDEGGATTVTRAEHDDARTTSGISYRTFDYAPSVKQFAKMVTEDYDSNNVRTKRNVETLVSFKPAA